MPDRTPSGIEGLDTVLDGGFIAGGIIIVQGRPGTGKTIFGNQICFNHARAGGRALYVTLLAESHGRMLMHLGGLAFFDPAAIPDQVYYISGFPVLETAGLHGLLTLLRREVRAHGATMLILDGLIAAETTAVSDLEFKKFIHELQIQATVANCTMFLMTSAGDTDAEISAEHTMVDCVIDMRSRLYGWRSERDIEVLKRRGAGYLLGRHAMAISNAGIDVYPRFEMTQTRPLGIAMPPGERLASGIPQLDAMFGGGIPQRSVTMLEGLTGVGKTTLGLHFLGPCSAAEPGLLFTVGHSPGALLAKARTLGLPVAKLIEAGHVEVVWQSTTEGLLDAALHRLLHSVQRMGARRLCIDGLAGLLQLAPDRTRLPAVFAALVHELRTLGVTSLLTSAVDDASGQPGSQPMPGTLHGTLSSIADNIITMHLAERKSAMVRLISVFKGRDAPIDPRPRLYQITSNGITIGDAPNDSGASPFGFAPGPTRPET